MQLFQISQEQQQQNTQEYQPTLAQVKVKKLIKMTCPNVNITADAEKSIEFAATYITKYVIQEATKLAQEDGTKTVTYKHIRQVIESTPGLAYLQDTIPEVYISQQVDK